MEIEATVHGAYEETDKAVFASLGRWIVDAEVHKRLGMAVTARDGDVWFVIRDIIAWSPRGFAQLRPIKGGKAGHIRYLFFTPDDLAAKRHFALHVLNHARAAGMRDVHTNDRRDSDVWPALGFKPKDNKRSGSFIRWEWSEAKECIK
ncbi:MAG TPA: hypothetical protein PKZ99_10700 [Azospirillaceae bacterium]|nr:hypothetical protein [Azospirillaceae bacterium]